MDMHMLVFQIEVRRQCRFFMLAAEETNAALKSLDPNDPDSVAETNLRIFYHVQSALHAAAHVARALWGLGGKKGEARKALRDGLGVTEDSPFRAFVDRKRFEQIDERIDWWWGESENHNVVDWNVGPSEQLPQLTEEINRFRHFDPNTTEATYFGETFSFQALVDEAQRILDLPDPAGL